MAETEVNSITTNGEKPAPGTSKGGLAVQTSVDSNALSLGSPTVAAAGVSSPPPGMSSPPGVGLNPIPSFGNPNDPVHDLPMELLQAGWRKFWSKREGRPYLFNKITNQSLWEMPSLGRVSEAKVACCWNR